MNLQLSIAKDPDIVLLFIIAMHDPTIYNVSDLTTKKYV